MYTIIFVFFQGVILFTTLAVVAHAATIAEHHAEDTSVTDNQQDTRPLGAVSTH